MLINEFGEVGLDHQLVERIDETVVLLRSGCLCCTIRGELAQRDARPALKARARGRCRRSLGWSSRVPVWPIRFPILTTLKADPVLRHHFRAGAVITTVDAVNGLSQIERHVESIRQIAVADRLVLTKTDLADPAAIDALLARVRQINPDAPVIRMRPRLDAGALLDQGGTGARFRASPACRRAG